MLGRGSRYERRSRARARRVQRRLEEVQRNQGTRHRPASLKGQLGAPTSGRSRGVRAGIFVGSLLIGVFVAQAVTATIVSWWTSEPLALESIAVQGTKRLTSEDVAWATGLEKGSPLDLLSRVDLETKISAHPWIREARVAVLPTGTLIVDVTEQAAQAVLRAEGGDYFIDANGVPFALAEAAEAQEAAALPLLLGPMEEAESVRDGLAIAAKLDQIALPGLADPSSAHRGLELQLPSQAPDPRHGWVLRGAGHTEVILGSDDVATVHDRLDRLARLLDADLGELEETTTIDLRFAGQAVLRKTSTSR